MDEESFKISDINVCDKCEPLYLCKCLLPDASEDDIIISPRKEKILTTVSRTENYLKERRIPELIRFLLTKVLAEGSEKPVAYLESLLDDCMLFRLGHALAPVLYEDRHLEAIVKSFDPGQRGWLNAGQVRRAFMTLGLTLEKDINDRISTSEVLVMLKTCQEEELFNLLSAGMED